MLDLSRLSPRERLAAEQAILTLRALDKAADDAPHGQGFDCLKRSSPIAGFNTFAT